MEDFGRDVMEAFGHETFRNIQCEPWISRVHLLIGIVTQAIAEFPSGIAAKIAPRPRT